MLSQRLLVLAFFLVPFENLSVAPSAGWPAVSPLFFLLIVALNFKKIEFSKKEISIIFILLLWSVLGWLLSFLVSDGNRFFIRDVSGSLLPLILGYAFYKTLMIIIDNEQLLRRAIDSFIVGSIVSLLCSLGILVFGFIAQIPMILDVLDVLLKRNADLVRFSFFFAEPSFVSVHLLGFIIPLIYICKLCDFNAQFWKLSLILALYIVVGFLYMESARYYIDMFFVCVIFVVFWLSNSFKTPSTSKLLFILLLSMPFCMLLYSSPVIVEHLTLGRVDIDNNFDDMIGSDASLASRFFRSDAVVSAVFDNVVLIFTGVGYGNIGLLVDLGYEDALTRFTSSYMKELFDIYNYGNGSNIYNMYVRMLGEFGIVVPVIIILSLYDKRHSFLFLIACWCYLQFDSYAFYAIWIYLAVCGSKSIQTKRVVSKKALSG